MRRKGVATMGLTDQPDDSGLGRIGPIGRGLGERIHIEHLPKPKNSAGRDLPTAITVGIVLGALVILSIWIGPVAWYPTVAAAIGLATWETVTRLRERSFMLPRTFMIVAGQAMVWLSWPFGTAGVIAAFASSALILMFTRMFHHGVNQAPSNYLRDTAVGVFLLVWIPLLGSFAAMLSLLESWGVPGSFFIVTFMVCVVASDTGGYIAGVMFGSRPMAPAISPNKSWEGAAGSLIFGTIAGTLLVGLLLDEPWWIGSVLGIALVVCATLGDLVESQFKREIAIKDMSGLIPGHGGVMDRLDGMLPAAAVTWIVLAVLTSPGW